MTYVLALTIALTVLTSMLCSLVEAALYSLPLSYARHLSENGSAVGRVLLGFKEDMSRPISAILILNTTANTAGPAVAGALISDMWGEKALAVFAVGISIAILFLGEMAPKIAGVSHARPVAFIAAFPVRFLIFLFGPVMWLSRWINRALKPSAGRPSVSHEEVLSLAAIGTEEGALDHFEGSVITNVIGLDKLLVRDVLTPRVVVFRIPEDRLISDLRNQIQEWNFTRIPLHDPGDPDLLTGYVLQLDLYRELVAGPGERRLKHLARPLTVVPELMRVDKLLLQMFEKKEQICAVVDEHGALAGIITIEDLMEEIVGREIVDEYDTVTDLRTFASLLKVARARRKEKGDRGRGKPKVGP